MKRNERLLSLRKFTKADLIWIIERAYCNGHNFGVMEAISSLENKKQFERLKKCDELSQEAAACRRRYIDLIKPYEGKTLSEIPRDILEKASCEIEKAQKLDKEWDRLIKQC